MLGSGGLGRVFLIRLFLPSFLSVQSALLKYQYSVVIIHCAQCCGDAGTVDKFCSQGAFGQIGLSSFTPSSLTFY